MGIGEKFSKALNKIKGKLIVAGILWFVLTIVFVAPWGLSFEQGARVSGTSNIINFTSDGWKELFLKLGNNIMHPLSSTISCFAGEANGHFWGTWWKFTLVYLLAITIGIIKAMPKHEYDGIENGSSDWCVNGEQYSVLSPKEGIILAEKNYLPVNKRGNVNVLVVGRIWFW